MCRQERLIVDESCCSACLLGRRLGPLRYECDSCHRVQPIVHPMYRYQPTAADFGNDTWACHVGCQEQTHWRILPAGARLHFAWFSPASQPCTHHHGGIKRCIDGHTCRRCSNPAGGLPCILGPARSVARASAASAARGAAGYADSSCRSIYLSTLRSVLAWLTHDGSHNCMALVVMT